MSPYADFSVAGGKVTVSGMAMSAAGEIVLHIGFMDADGKVYIVRAGGKAIKLIGK